MTFLKKPFLILPILFSIFSCVEIDENPTLTDDDSDQDTGSIFDSPEEIIEELNEQGLLKFRLFSGNSESEGKVIEGSDENFNYIGYGEFTKNTSDSDYYPKNIKSVVQLDPKNNSSIQIDLDDNYLPKSFKSTYFGIENDTIYKVSYDSQQTVIQSNMTSNGGDTLLLDTYVLGGITLKKAGFDISVGKNERDCMEDFNICKEGNIYEKYGDDWEEASKNTSIRHVGKFINWLVKVSKEKFCSNNGKVSSNFTAPVCESITSQREPYLKHLSTGRIFTFGQITNPSVPYYENDYSFDRDCDKPSEEYPGFNYLTFFRTPTQIYDGCFSFRCENLDVGPQPILLTDTFRICIEIEFNESTNKRIAKTVHLNVPDSFEKSYGLNKIFNAKVLASEIYSSFGDFKGARVLASSDEGLFEINVPIFEF